MTMRVVMTALLGLALAACSNEPKAGEAGLGEFDPPVVGVRGDVVPRQQARFARLDQNVDGYLTPDEFPKRNPQRIAALDGDGDGRVSRSELVEGMLKRFDARDANRDGQVTPQERDAAGRAH